MTRRSLLSTAALPLASAMTPEPLSVWRDDQNLRVHAPYLHFLEGQPLERLHTGAAIVFSLQLSLSADRFSTVIRRNLDRFVVSFDLWEEKFAITQLGVTRVQASHLTRELAERWVVDHAALPLDGLAADRPLWLRFELRADDPRASASLLLDPGVTLARLIEWFGRPQRGESNRWTLDRGPFRLTELKR